MLRERAASDALSSSLDIEPSLIETESMAQGLNLVLRLREYGEVVRVDEHVTAIFERCQQVRRTMQVVDHTLRWLFYQGTHVLRMVGSVVVALSQPSHPYVWHSRWPLTAAGREGAIPGNE
jgi:hypothetical protein